jgi:hypothetical protein
VTDPSGFPPATLTCVDCGGSLHLLTLLDPDWPPAPDDVFAYRCDSCLERFDLVFESDDSQLDQPGS